MARDIEYKKSARKLHSVCTIFSLGRCVVFVTVNAEASCRRLRMDEVADTHFSFRSTGNIKIGRMRRTRRHKAATISGLFLP